MMTSAAQLSVVKERFRLTAFILPIVFTIFGLGIQFATFSNVPNPMALNWELNGSPSGEGSPWVNIVLTAVFGIAVPHLIALTIFGGIKRGHTGATARMLGAFIPAFSLFIVLIATLSHVIQLENATAMDAHMPVGLIPTALVMSIIVGFVTWFSFPEMSASLRPARHSGIAQTDSALTAWEGSTSCGRVLGTVVIAIIAIAVLSPLIVWALSGEAVIIAILVVVAIAALIAGMSATAYTVIADQNGLKAKSRFGFPTFTVPMDDIVGVDIVDIDPMSDFGGWGVRWIPGNFGLILRRGTALRVIRRSGKNFVVTLPDPGPPAGVIQSNLNIRDE